MQLKNINATIRKKLRAKKYPISRQNGRIDVPKMGKHVLPKRVLPNWGHHVVVPFFKLAAGLQHVIANINVKIKKLKAFENGLKAFQVSVYTR